MFKHLTALLLIIFLSCSINIAKGQINIGLDVSQAVSKMNVHFVLGEESKHPYTYSWNAGIFGEYAINSNIQVGVSSKISRIDGLLRVDKASLLELNPMTNLYEEVGTGTYTLKAENYFIELPVTLKIQRDKWGVYMNYITLLFIDGKTNYNGVFTVNEEQVTMGYKHDLEYNTDVSFALGVGVIRQLTEKISVGLDYSKGITDINTGDFTLDKTLNRVSITFRYRLIPFSKKQ